MNNQLTDLNNHLFAQIERLGDEDKTSEEIENEIERAKAIAGVADRVISNADLMLRAQIARTAGTNKMNHPLLAAPEPHPIAGKQ